MADALFNRLEEAGTDRETLVSQQSLIAIYAIVTAEYPFLYAP